MDVRDFSKLQSMVNLQVFTIQWESDKVEELGSFQALDSRGAHIWGQWGISGPLKLDFQGTLALLALEWTLMKKENDLDYISSNIGVVFFLRPGAG